MVENASYSTLRLTYVWLSSLPYSGWVLFFYSQITRKADAQHVWRT